MRAAILGNAVELLRATELLRAAQDPAASPITLTRDAPPYLGPSIGDRVLTEQQKAAAPPPKSFHECHAEGMRAQSLRQFLKRKRYNQPSHKCRCGRTISGNKQHCSSCAGA